MGFVHPVHEGLLKTLGVDLDPRGNVRANTADYQTSLPKVFSAGDMRRGQSLVVWAIREGRLCARVDRSVPDGDDEFAAVTRSGELVLSTMNAIIVARWTVPQIVADFFAGLNSRILSLPRYHALIQPLEIKTRISDLITLAWEDYGIIADFIIPGDDKHTLRVHFEKTDIVRILDEMPLSTESEDTKPVGLVPEHFAYVVEDSLFWKSQSEAFKIVFKKARHYRFITGSICLDVISDKEPMISVNVRGHGSQ